MTKARTQFPLAPRLRMPADLRDAMKLVRIRSPNPRPRYLIPSIQGVDLALQSRCPLL